MYIFLTLSFAISGCTVYIGLCGFTYLVNMIFLSKKLEGDDVFFILMLFVNFFVHFLYLYLYTVQFSLSCVSI